MNVHTITTRGRQRWGKLLLSMLCLVCVSVTPDRSFSQSEQAVAEFSHQVTVVRAWFDDRSMVTELVQIDAPWEVNYEEGYLVIGLSDDGLTRSELEQRGFRVTIDEELTDYYNRPATNVPDTPGTANSALPGIPGFACYRTVEETYASARNLVSSNPQLAQWIDIGDSWEKANGFGGYDIYVLKLTNPSIPGPKPVFFNMSSVHAREYTPAELNTRFAEYLLGNYGVDADATWLLDHHEIHLILMANPDGRKFAEAGALWRKSTNRNTCLSTPSRRGIDLNRNFPFRWGCCGGSSVSECSQTYRGPNVQSEVETQAIIEYVRSIFPDQRGPGMNDAAPANATGLFIDTHSFSELVLWPWGFENVPAPNGAALTALGRKLARFNSYTPQQSPELYIVDGSTTDFAYGELGVAAYTFELGTTFFQDCLAFETQILPDNLQALIYAAKAARSPYTQGNGPDVRNLSLSSDSVSQGDPVVVTAIVDDTRYNNSNGLQATQQITAAELFIDTPPWRSGAVPVSLTAVDGGFNERVESTRVQIDTSQLAVGRHTLFVRGRDATGNWGVVSAEFLNVGTGGSQPALSAIDTSVNESDGSASIAVRLSESSSQTVRVTAFTRSGSAQGGSDFYGATRTLIFDPGETEQQFPLTILNDVASEATETMSIILVNPVNASIADNSATVTIEDDDAAGGVRISVRDLSVDESVGVARVAVELSQPSSNTVRVVAYTRINSATPGQDYYGVTSQLSFPPGSTRQEFALTILNDAIVESSETTGVRLVRPVNAVLADDEATITILDDDSAGTVQFSVADLTVNENTGTANVAIRLSQASAQTTSVLVFTQTLSADAGQDFYGKTQRLTFSPGQTVRNFSVTILDDSVPEPTETVRVRLANAVGAPIGDDRAVLSISDND